MNKFCKSSAQAMMIALVLGFGPGAARGEEPTEEETIERIVELRNELARLEAGLSEAAQAALEARLRELGQTPDVEPPPPGTPLTPVEPKPPEVDSEPLPSKPEQLSVPEPDGPVRARCGTLGILDTNGDGVVSGADRNWRYLALWKDDGNGSIEESELKSLFEHGIRKIGVRLVSYTNAKDVDGAIWVEDRIFFELPGRRGRAVLVIEAGRLARSEQLWLENSTGSRVLDTAPLERGLRWVDVEFGSTDAFCG